MEAAALWCTRHYKKYDLCMSDGCEMDVEKINSWCCNVYLVGCQNIITKEKGREKRWVKN